MRASLVCVAIGLLLLGCSSPGKQTTDELRAEIEAYRHGDAAASEDRMTALFAKLDADIATLRADEAAASPSSRAELTARREALEAERRALQGQYLQARVARLGEAAGNALKGVGDQIGQGLEEAGRKMREAVQDGKPAPAE